MNPEEKSLLFGALSRAMRQSEFWRRRMDTLGVAERDLTHGFPYHELPLVSKEDLLADQAEKPPFGRLLAVPADAVRRIHRTSGTSAVPLFVALTDRDIEDTYVSAVRAFRLAGMGPGDRVVHCLNFNMWSGGITDYMPIERLKATAIPFGVGNTSLLLSLIRRLSVNAISSTPSYMLTLRDRCREELGIDPRELGLRRGYFGGEGLLQVEGVRETIEEAFGMVAMDANYGMSEIQSVIAGEGPERDGLVSHTHGILATEIVDAGGNTIPLVPGAVGELVFSTLRREAQPLFRYRTNDLAEVAATDIGDDGLMRIKFHIRGRTDQMLVVKGVNFFPQSLMSLVAEFPELGQNFRVIRPQAGSIDSVDVVLETGLGASEYARLAQVVERRASALFQVRIRAHFVPKGFLPVDANKSRYIVDSISAVPGLETHVAASVNG
ncbi:MAG: phenylacetate--CoA ligase family protein [Gemmatimonas sp.]